MRIKQVIKLLTNEAFLGCAVLGCLGALATIYGHIELAGVAVGGVAAMLRGKEGEKEEGNDT